MKLESHCVGRRLQLIMFIYISFIYKMIWRLSKVGSAICFPYLIDWLIGMLLVSRSGLVEEDAFLVFHYYGFHLSSSFLMWNFKPYPYLANFNLISLKCLVYICHVMCNTNISLFSGISESHVKVSPFPELTLDIGLGSALPRTCISRVLYKKSFSEKINDHSGKCFMFRMKSIAKLSICHLIMAQINKHVNFETENRDFM